jgi:two-component system, cell cycle response regulator DivK
MAAGARPKQDVPPVVLVVDDYDDVREMYCEYLVYDGFDAKEARNGQQAIELAIALRPSVIVMDLSMPFLDGWQATRMLKADGRTRGVPIIVLTGNAQPDQTDRARCAGADLVLTKPCQPRMLAAVLRKLLGRRDKNGA